MELYLIVKIRAKRLQEHVEHRFELLRRIYCKRHSAPEQSERGKHSYQSEAMVTMNMADEYRHDFIKADVRATHLRLRALTTVNHKLLATQFNDLRRRVVAQCRESGAAAKYVNLKWFHILLLLSLECKYPLLILYVERVGFKRCDVERVTIEKELTIENLPRCPWIGLRLDT